MVLPQVEAETENQQQQCIEYGMYQDEQGLWHLCDEDYSVTATENDLSIREAQPEVDDTKESLMEE